MVLFWFRRDLRIEDNVGLYNALKSGEHVQPVFIFDTDILNELQNKKDKRVSFIYEQLKAIQEKLESFGSKLWVFNGNANTVFEYIIANHNISGVYANEDYEPQAIKRDLSISAFLDGHKIPLHTFKDHVVFSKDEVLKGDGTPYVVFTPYMRAWKAKLHEDHLRANEIESYAHNFHKTDAVYWKSLDDIGFEEDLQDIPEKMVSIDIVKTYNETRDFPAIKGTTKMSVHLRFGTISIRKMVILAQQHNEIWLNELIWRDFYQMIMFKFPHSANASFRPKYDRIVWSSNMEHFKAWCEGNTGYPIVDAGMRELNTTGFMHNRVRMIVASFFCKHLLLDWRLGERYFAEKLIDFDLASNVGGWQWAAGSGCDAAPYFRIFNPYLQTDKFDKQRSYINKWVPEWQDPFTYPNPIVDHKEAREKALRVYKEALN